MVNNERIAGRNKFAVYIIRPVICLIIAGLFISCHNLYSDSLESALNMAGENRKELEKVLDRYKSCPEDSLKYKAACFLIENMPYYSYHEGELLDNYLTYFKLLRENKKTTLSPDDISDSIVKKYGSYSIHALKQKKDIQEIDSAFLCHNIEWAFKVWQEQPWGKNVSFDHFCEYILPYRIDNEKPEYWREDLYNKYNHLLSSLRNSLSKEADDPISAVYLLMEHITKEDIYYTTTTPASLPHVGASVAQFRSGSCRELTDYAIYVCRALGIPCHIDFMPVRGDNNVGHFWISFQAKNGDLYMQEFPDAVWNVQKAGMKGSRKTKVYRYTFSVNRKMRNELASFDSSFPALFLNPKLIDVTYPYTKHYLSQLNIPSSRLYDKKKRGLVYLCTHQSFSWTPVAWGIIDRNGANFSDLQKGDVWRLAAREGDKLEFISDPFMVHPYSNQLTFYSSEQNSQRVVLFSKFETASEFGLKERMIGGVFEGSNEPDFSQKDTLYVINRLPERLNTAVNVYQMKKYKYVRYYGRPGVHCNVSEIAFFENMHDTIPLKGEIIGTPGSADPYDPHEYTNALDGKTWTSFDYKERSGGWVGLKFPEPTRISKIVYTPRNRDNYIRPGDDFELFYLDKTWKSLGQIQSTADSIVYENVPKDALLYLKCHSRGSQEWIFTYEDGKQNWL